MKLFKSTISAILLFSLSTANAATTRTVDADTIKNSAHTKSYAVPSTGSASQTILTNDSTATVTNKSYSGSSNTFTNIPYSALSLTGNIVNADVSSSAAISYSKLNLVGQILNADISSSAAIAYSKLALSGSIVNADIATAAAIAYSKLSLTGSIVNADISSSAAIAYSKLSLTGSIVTGDLASGFALGASKGGTGNTSYILGDLLIGNGSATLSRLSSGSPGQVLTADASAGVKWASGSSGSAGYNILRDYNPEFSNGTANWTASGGTFAAATSTDILFDTGTTWDSNSAGQTLCSNLTAIPQGLKGNNGYAYIWTAVPSGTATHTLSVSDGTNTLISTPIISSTVAKKNPITFAIPSSGSVKLCLTSVAANEPLIDIAKAFIGEMPNVSAAAPMSDWAAYSLSVGGTTTAPTLGTTSTNIARWRRVGDSMQIRYQLNMTAAGTAGSGTYLFPLPSGYTIDSNKLTTSTGASVSEVGEATIYADGAAKSASGNVKAYNSTNLFVAVQTDTSAYTDVGSTFFSLGNNVVQLSFTATVPITGWTSQTTAVTPDQTNYGWISYTPTVTGGGTVSSVNCFHKRDAADLLLRCSFVAGTATATEARVSLPNSLTTADSSMIAPIEIAGGWGDSTSDQSGWVLAEPSKGYITFGQINQGTVGGLVKRNGSSVWSTGATVQFTARVAISGWVENGKAPVLVGSVTSGATGAEKIERAQITVSNSAAAIVSQSGSWLSVANGASAGLTTGTMTGFSSAPACTCTVVGAASASASHCLFTAEPSSTTILISRNRAGAAENGDVNIICMGSR